MHDVPPSRRSAPTSRRAPAPSRGGTRGRPQGPPGRQQGPPQRSGQRGYANRDNTARGRLATAGGILSLLIVVGILALVGALVAGLLILLVVQ